MFSPCSPRIVVIQYSNTLSEPCRFLSVESRESVLSSFWRIKMAKRVVVFGGAGFIGSNLSMNLLDSGCHVTVFDSLARRGSELNIDWLQQSYGVRQLEFIQDDIRDAKAVQRAVRNADEVYHLAAQVAVTTSVDDPRTDFEVNALGTLNVLEGVRQSGRRPPMVFTS